MTRKSAETPYELDRRTFIGGAAATGVAMAVGRQGAAAGPGSAPARSIRLQDDEPTIIIGTLGEAQTINPFLSANDSESDWRCKMLYDELVHIDPATYAPEPGIAESWIIDNLTFTFQIRDNATFSDGTDLTADDVAFTYEQYLNPANASPRAAKYSIIKGAQEYIDGTADSISGITVVDPKTISVELTEANAAFLYNQRFIFVVPKIVGRRSDRTRRGVLQRPSRRGTVRLRKLGGWLRLRRHRKPVLLAGRQTRDQVVHPSRNCRRQFAGAGARIWRYRRIELSGADVSRSARGQCRSCRCWCRPSHRQTAGSSTPRSKRFRRRKRAWRSLWRSTPRPSRPTLCSAWAPRAMDRSRRITGRSTTELTPIPFDVEQARALMAEAGVAEGTKIRFNVNQGNIFREDWLDLHPACAQGNRHRSRPGIARICHPDRARNQAGRLRGDRRRLLRRDSGTERALRPVPLRVGRQLLQDQRSRTGRPPDPGASRARPRRRQRDLPADSGQDARVGAHVLRLVSPILSMSFARATMVTPIAPRTDSSTPSRNGPTPRHNAQIGTQSLIVGNGVGQSASGQPSGEAQRCLVADLSPGMFFHRIRLSFDLVGDRSRDSLEPNHGQSLMPPSWHVFVTCRASVGTPLSSDCYQY